MGVEGRQGFAGLKLDEDDGVPYLVNLHSDPQLSEKVKYRIREGELTIGSASECDIQLGGVYILDVHCTLQCQFVGEGDGGRGGQLLAHVCCGLWSALLLPFLDGCTSRVSDRCCPTLFLFVFLHTLSPLFL